MVMAFRNDETSHSIFGWGTRLRDLWAKCQRFEALQPDDRNRRDRRNINSDLGEHMDLVAELAKAKARLAWAEEQLTEASEPKLRKGLEELRDIYDAAVKGIDEMIKLREPST